MSRHTEAQMIGAVRKLEAGRRPGDVAREVGVSRQTIYFWQAKYGRMGVSQALEAKRLSDENMRLRKLIADLKFEAGCNVEDVALEVGVSTTTIYAWKAKCTAQAQDAKRLRDENTRLQKLAANLTLEEELHSENAQTID